MLRETHARILRGLIMIAFILGTFVYMALLVILPLLLGPWGLLVAIVVSLEIVYYVRRQRRQPRRQKLIWRPGRVARLENTNRLLAGEVAAGFALGLFAVLLVLIGAVVRVESIRISDPTPIYLVGAVIARFWMWRLIVLSGMTTYYETVDTTDDR